MLTGPQQSHGHSKDAEFQGMARWERWPLALMSTDFLHPSVHGILKSLARWLHISRFKCLSEIVFFLGKIQERNFTRQMTQAKNVSTPMLSAQTGNMPWYCWASGLTITPGSGFEEQNIFTDSSFSVKHTLASDLRETEWRIAASPCRHTNF